MTFTRSALTRHDAEVVGDDDHGDRRAAATGPSSASQDLRLDGYVQWPWSARRRSVALGLQARPMAIITRWRMPP